jgi:riboflavin biosynthesis pyrimidine reductase
VHVSLKCPQRTVRICAMSCLSRWLNDPAFSGYLSIPAVLRTLHALGLRSLMVEGGGQIIQSFLSEAMPDKSGKSILHRVIITIAHFFVGERGVGYRLNQSRVSINI